MYSCGLTPVATGGGGGPSAVSHVAAEMTVGQAGCGDDAACGRHVVQVLDYFYLLLLLLLLLLAPQRGAERQGSYCGRSGVDTTASVGTAVEEVEVVFVVVATTTTTTADVSTGYRSSSSVAPSVTTSTQAQATPERG